MSNVIRLLLLLLSGPSVCWAQVDYNKIILPDEVPTDSLEFTEKLVQVAWRNHPEGHILQKQARIASLDVEKAKRDWLNNIRLSGNLNEYSGERLFNNISGSDVDENAAGNRFFPIYNFGVTLPLGIFFDNPRNTKIAQEQYGIAQDNINARKLNLRAVVLALYQEYLMQKEVLEIQTGITESRYARLQLAEQQFSDGDIPVEELEEAQLQYSQQRINSIRAEKDFVTAKLSLEELLGLPLEDI